MPPAKKTANKSDDKDKKPEVDAVDKTEDKGKKKEEETVVVNKGDLERFLTRLDNLEKDNKRLIAVADKGRLANEREKELAADGAPLVRTVKLTRLEAGGPIVVAWKLTENDSYVDGNRMVEKQSIQVVFQDGSTTNMRLIDFYRKQKNNRNTTAEIISRSRDEKTGDTLLKVELRDGEQIDIPLAFVN